MAVVGLATEFLELGYRVRMPVAGQSMAPAIESGDTVVVEPVDPANLRPGEIIVCRDGFGRMRMHRLVGRCPQGPAWFITRGDNLTGCDLPRDASQVLGRVVAVERPLLRRLRRGCEAILRAATQPLLTEP